MLNPVTFRLAIHHGGETIRLLQAIPHSCYDPSTNYDAQRGCEACLFGYLYTELTLPATVKVLLTQVKQRYLHETLGWVRVGDLKCQNMPDEIWFGPMDRVIRVQAVLQARERFTHGTTDKVAQPYPVAIQALTSGATLYVPTTDYTFNAATGIVTWVHPPATATVVTAVYTYHPVYWYVMADETPPRPLPMTNVLSPQSGYLVLKQPGEA